jgi:hypothetical protein
MRMRFTVISGFLVGAAPRRVAGLVTLYTAAGRSLGLDVLAFGGACVLRVRCGELLPSAVAVSPSENESGVVPEAGEIEAVRSDRVAGCGALPAVVLLVGRCAAGRNAGPRAGSPVIAAVAR